jgi:hypothetical protein
MFRWISYSQLNIPGNVSFKLDRHKSIADAREAFETFCRNSGYPDSSMTLYVYSGDAWDSAKSFEDIGCPFDYPTKMITRGPRNGIKIEQC